MAKYRSATHIRGKIGDMVYTDGKNGPAVRMSPQFSEKQLDAKRELPLMQKTKLLNHLASGLHKAAKEYASTLRSADFFHRVQKRFHAEKTEEPVLLLHALRNIELHPDYVFGGNCSIPQTTMHLPKGKYDLEIKFEPAHYRMKGNNSFYLEMILFVFSGETVVMRTESQATPWLRTNEKGERAVSMSFKRKVNDRYYLLACRCVFATNFSEKNSYWSDTRMRFIYGNALRKEDLQRIANHPGVLQDMRVAKNAGKVVREVKRVEMRVV